MTSEKREILLLGLPETGKTSFLAALLHYVDAPIPDKNLSQYQLSSNTTYVTSIVQNWLKGKKPERTKVTATKNAKTVADIFLEDKITEQKFTLHVPDFFGETFENQFSSRLIENEYLDQITSASGILLFIHPDKISQPTLIEDIKIAHKIEKLINDESGVDSVVKNENSIHDNNVNIEKDANFEIPSEPTFIIEDCPTQTILVDILETHLEFLKSHPVKLAIIISAWDLVHANAPRLSPLKWIENVLPLLYQFLLTNPERVIFKSFGISAQGGNIENPEEVERLTNFSEPSDRISVQEEDSIHKNIASPIEWILQQWQKPTI